MGFPPDGLASAMRYRPAASDLFVATYPKCGTTWVQYILYLLFRQQPIRSDERLGPRFPHLEEAGAELIEQGTPPRLIKTHLPVAMAPWSPEARYVVVIRNPFDCAVSFYFHTRGFPKHYDFADGEFADFVACFIAGEVDFGDYFDHLLPWVAKSDCENVSVVRYEDLRRNPAKLIRQIGVFCGGAAEQFVHDDDALEWVVHESSLERMKRDQQRWSSPRPEDLPFVRAGAVGRWQDLFSPAAARLLAEKFRRRTVGTAAADLWPEVIAEAEGL